MNHEYLHASLKQIPTNKKNGMALVLTEIEDWFFNEGHPDIANTIQCRNTLPDLQGKLDKATDEVVVIWESLRELYDNVDSDHQNERPLNVTDLLTQLEQSRERLSKLIDTMG